MEIEDLPQSPDEKYKFQFTFDAGDQALAVWSAYRESVVRRVAARLPVQEHELLFSQFNGEENTRIKVGSAEDVAAILDEFHLQTEAAILSLAQYVAVPFESDHIARRIRLGKIADDLASLIRIRDSNNIGELFREVKALPPAQLTDGEEPASQTGA